jgi:hypothetical protein
MLWRKFFDVKRIDAAALKSVHASGMHPEHAVHLDSTRAPYCLHGCRLRAPPLRGQHTIEHVGEAKGWISERRDTAADPEIDLYTQSIEKDRHDGEA